MNGNIVIKKFDYPPSVLPVSPYPVDELPISTPFPTELRKGVEIHYDLTVFGDQPADMAFFIQKMEEDLRKLKETLLRF